MRKLGPLKQRILAFRRRWAPAPSANRPAFPVPGGAFNDKPDPVVLVHLNDTSMVYYYRYGETGWSHLRRAAEIYLQGRSRQGVMDFLEAYFEAFCPTNLADVCCLQHVEPLATLSPFHRFEPWRRTISRVSGHDGSGNQNFGPVSRTRLEKEADRIVALCRSLEHEGYRPEAYDDGYIRGYLLTRDEEFVFVVTKGQHRTAVLSALGEKTFAAQFDPKMPRLIDAKTLPMWPHVTSGYCTPELASVMFNRHFEPFADPRMSLVRG